MAGLRLRLLPSIPNGSNIVDPWDDEKPGIDVSASTGDRISGASAQGQPGNQQALVTDLKKLQEHIVQLQAKAKYLESAQQIPEPIKVQILYRIRHGTRMSVPYLDHPRNSSVEGAWSTLYSQSPVKNFELYLERHKEISLVVYRDFEESNKKESEDQETTDSGVPPPQLQHYREVLRPVSGEMFNAIRAILRSKPEYAEILKGFNTTSEISSPFLFFFHSFKNLKEIEKQISDSVRRQLKLLANYVLGVYGAEYKVAEAMIAQGRFSADYLCYFFKPNDIIIYRERDSVKGYVCDSWLGQPRIQKSSKQSQMPFKDNSTNTGSGSESNDESTNTYTWDISVWSWCYDGHFHREKGKLRLDVVQINREKQMVNSLNIFPLQFAELTLREQLGRRGEMFWKCRFCRPVSYYEDASSDRLSTHGERYMVDMKTYQKIHASSISLKSAISEFKMTEEDMAADDPPDDQFKYVVPLMMKGFNLRRKKWLDLKVDQISDVQWNKRAFKSLVVESRTKDLIQALVSKQLSIERSTDLIEDKGNGLILLLHGGPGTGKTLTAESVAEIAEKPLYRVTCGDIGIKAEEVEKYLESVLHLGKIWGCVVLLDEADVFLEQRTLEDLARNALVSVFLRVLEYYDGILVLTSNRVGTFDEAFKSRIQLALHYADLEEYQRQQIWTNFIDRLEGLEEDVDLSDLRDNVQRLAKDEMNGRQIRNAITTARQFAEWKGEKLNYKHLEYVIEVSGRFDKYLDKLNGGLTQNELAREDRIR
jgi:Cdc6-like AAA superfamily ATPase